MSAPAAGRGWLEGNVALVTGGGSGIGRAVARRFVDEGASVVVLDQDQAKLDELAKSAPDSSRVLGVTGDVRSGGDLHAAVGAAVERFGKLDTLVANAGIWDYQRQLTRMSADELSAGFDELFSINVKGYLLAAEAAWRELVKTRGTIVMTLSNASFYPNGGGPLYTASKHACSRADARARLRAGAEGPGQRGRLRRDAHGPARPRVAQPAGPFAGRILRPPRGGS